MNKNTFERALIAKLHLQGYRYADDERSSDLSMLFLHMEGGKPGFYLPRPHGNPSDDHCWSVKQLNEISRYLEYFGLELLPLDLNL